jgi:mRNA interferase MazF
MNNTIDIQQAPKKGDIIFCNLSPTIGHEQGGFRPSVIVSEEKFNLLTGLVVICPITSKIKDFPFEVVFNSVNVKGAVITHQIRTIDWRERNIEIRDVLNSEDLQKVMQKIKVILG